MDYALGGVEVVEARQRRIIAAIAIGNALEWFDFVIFGFLAATMARVFFPSSDQHSALLYVFATFGITFLVRPLGAILIGSFADRHGRKKALLLTIGMMTLGTGAIAVAPTYEAVGVLAPVYVLLARTIQGFSAGGEFGAATALLAEQDPTRRGFFASWQFASQGLTTVLASTAGLGLNYGLTVEQLDSWGWRLPFLFGIAIGPLIYALRKTILESTEFRESNLSKSPIRELASDRHFHIVWNVGLIAFATISMYTLLFLPSFAVKQLGLAPASAYACGIATGIIQFLIIPIIGRISDRHSRMPYLLCPPIMLFILAYPMFVLMTSSPSIASLLVIECLIGVLSGVYLGALGGVLANSYPTQVRTTGLSVSNAIAVTLFGGFAPLISAWLISVTGSSHSPSFYLMFGSAITIASLVISSKMRLKF